MSAYPCSSASLPLTASRSRMPWRRRMLWQLSRELYWPLLIFSRLSRQARTSSVSSTASMSSTAYIADGHLSIPFPERGFRLSERGFLGNYSFGFSALSKHMPSASSTFLLAHLYLRRSFSKALEVRDYAPEDCYFILQSRTASVTAHFFSLLVTDNAGYIVARTVNRSDRRWAMEIAMLRTDFGCGRNCPWGICA